MKAVVEIQISDPWDLGEAMGWKPVRGEFMQMAPVVIKLHNPIPHSGQSINWLVGTPRVVGRECLSREPTSFNFRGFAEVGKNPSALLAAWRGPKDGLALIGTCYLVEADGRD